MVDTQKGFVDTFNWAVQSIANLKGGENCEVTWPTDDHPTIDCTAQEGEGGDSGGGGGDISAVYDVLSAVDENDVSGLTIQYVDDREEKFIPFPALSGGGGERQSLPGPFEMSLSGTHASFSNCVMRIARAYFFFQDQTLQVPRTDQIIYVKAEHTDPPTIELSSGPYATVSQNLSARWSNMLSVTVTPLYRVLSGEVKCDYRYMMNVQAYDSKNYHYGM